MVGQIGGLGLKTLGMTTNGLTLARKAENLASLGMNSINISLDSLVEDKFTFITRRKGFKLVKKGIESALANFPEVKIN